MKIQLNIIGKTHKYSLVFVGFFVLSVNAYADEGVVTTPHIQTLAASCAACHGSQGNSVGGTSVLAGLDASHFVLQMMAFRNGSRSSTVMHRHAKGLTVEEINDLAVYFAQQKRVTALTPPNQRLAE
jgi:cytochrome subunit of sulfide dehydrogenase